MWWQGKEFSQDREADRLRRAQRGWLLVVAVLVAPLIVLLLQAMAHWVGLLPRGGITFHIING